MSIPVAKKRKWQGSLKHLFVIQNFLFNVIVFFASSSVREWVTDKMASLMNISNPGGSGNRKSLIVWGFPRHIKLKMKLSPKIPDCTLEIVSFNHCLRSLWSDLLQSFLELPILGYRRIYFVVRSFISFHFAEFCLPQYCFIYIIRLYK